VRRQKQCLGGATETGREGNAKNNNVGLNAYYSESCLLEIITTRIPSEQAYSPDENRRYQRPFFLYPPGPFLGLTNASLEFGFVGNLV
jgi:hypothetical protein